MQCQPSQQKYCTSKTHIASKKKLSKDNELHNAFYLADRLKITINEVMSMSMEEFQYWMGYLKLEERQHKLNASKHGKK